MTEQDGFREWAIVELFGHQKIAGLVSEQQLAGATWLRVDVPSEDGCVLFTRYYGGSAVYSITPCDEVTARRAAKALRPEPITVYLAPALPAAKEDNEADHGGF